MANNYRTSPPGRLSPGVFAAYLLLLLIILLTTPLRLYRLADPSMGGFQGYSEAGSVLVAESFLTGSQLQKVPAVRMLSISPPPGYPFLIYCFQWLSLSQLLIGRLIILVAGLLGVLLVFDLGRRLFNAGIGCLAAAFFAFAPVNVLLGRNAQSEMLGLTLLLLGHWILLRSGPDPDKLAPKGMRNAFLVWGIAALIHPFTLLALPVWLVSECLRRRDMSTLKNGAFWSAAGLALLPSLVFYGYHGARDFPGLLQAVWSTAQEATPAFAKVAFAELPSEAWWGYSPLLLLLFMAGLGWGLLQSAWQHRYLLLQAGAYMILALLFYRHNYTLVWLTPFASLLAAALLWQIPRRSIVGVIALLAVAQGTLVSLLVLCNTKYGFTELTQLMNYYKSTCHRCMILVREGLYDTKLRELQYYFGADRIVNLDRAEVDAGNQVRIDSLNDRIYLYFMTSSKGSGADFDVSRVVYAPVFFGYEIRASGPNFHRFNPGPIKFAKKYPWTYSGVHESGLTPSIAMIWISRSTNIYREGDSITFKQTP